MYGRSFKNNISCLLISHYFNLVKVRVNKISNIIDRRDRKKINNISIIPIVYKALTFRREIAVVIIKNYNLLFRNYL